MKLFCCLLIFAVLFTSFNSLAATIPPKPEPATFVNDYTSGMLTYEQKQSLENKLSQYSNNTSSQIVVVIVETTSPQPIADYSFELGRKWGIGNKQKNNGVVLTWAVKDREIFIATGYGTEGALTDALSRRIIENTIIPNFKTGAYYAGLDQATDQIIKIISGDQELIQKLQSQQPVNSPGKTIFFIIFIFLWIFMMRRRRGAFLIGAMGSSFIRSSGSFGGGGRSSFGGGSFGGGGAGGRY